MDLEEKLDGVAAALAELERREGKIIRASPVSEAEVIAIERHFRVVLPEEYRAFVTRIARGLTYPDIWSVDLCGWGGEEAVSWAQSDLRLSEPFELPPEWPDDEEAALAMEEELLEAPYRGFVPIAYWGCQYYDLLVVTGAERGHVFCAELPYDYEPLRFDSGPATFLEYTMFRIGNALAGRDSFQLLHRHA